MAQTRTTLFSLLLSLLGCLILLVHAGRDFYSILGIRRNANDKEIKKAFRKLSLKYHPDQNPSEAAKQKYLDINMAYETLTDPEKRKMFDQFGEEGVNQQAQQQQQQGGGNPFGGGFGFGGGGADPFSFFFGGGGGGRQQQFHRQQQQQQQQRYPAKPIYEDDANVLELTDVTWPFHKTENEEEKATIWLINFYSDQCGHCHQVAPTYRELAKETRGLVKIAAINCAKQATTCKQQGIEQYPTFKLFGYYSHSSPITFAPPNHEKATFVEYVYKNIPNFIKQETALTLLSKLNLGPYLPQVIIIAPSNRKPLLSPTLITLAKHFRNSFRFFAVPTPTDKNDPEFIHLVSFLSHTADKKLNIPTTITKPLFLIRTPTKVVHYTGPASFKELTTALSGFADEYKAAGYYSTGFGDFVLQTRGQVLDQNLLLALQNNPSAGYHSTFITCPYFVKELTEFDGFNPQKPTESKFSPLLPSNAVVESAKESQTPLETLTPSQIAFLFFEALQTTTKQIYFVDINDVKFVPLLAILASGGDEATESFGTHLQTLRNTCQSISASTQHNPLPKDIKQPFLGLGLNLKRHRITSLVQENDVDLTQYMSSLDTFLELNESSPQNSRPFPKKVKEILAQGKHDEL